MTTSGPSLYALGQQQCLANATAWLRAADLILNYASVADWQQAAVLFANAVAEIGKALELFRAERIGDLPTTVLDGCNPRRSLGVAQEGLGKDLLSITQDCRGADDLAERLAGFNVHSAWVPLTPIDGQRLPENLWDIQRRVSRAQCFGVQAFLSMHVDEFAPTLPEKRWSQDPVVNCACAIQEQRVLDHIHHGRRGPTPTVLNPEWLEWLYRKRPQYAAYLKSKKFVYYWMRGEVALGERAEAAERELVSGLFPKLSTGDRKKLAVALVRRGKRPTDIVTTLIARHCNTSEALVRKATKLLDDGRRRLQLTH